EDNMVESMSYDMSSFSNISNTLNNDNTLENQDVTHHNLREKRGQKMYMLLALQKLYNKKKLEHEHSAKKRRFAKKHHTKRTYASAKESMKKSNIFARDVYVI